jgi:hypothetical protein
MPLVVALIAFIGFLPIAATAAAVHVGTQAENRTSGSASTPDNLIEIQTRLSEVAVRENAALRYDLASDDAVAARGISSIVGRSFGRLGTVIENPGITIRGFRGSVTPGHAINQIVARGLSPGVVRATVANPTVVLEQAGGRLLYLTDQAAVVMTREGQVVTAWGQRDFLPSVLEVLSTAGMR